MIMKMKNGQAVITGRVTRNGSERRSVGKGETKLWSASVLVENVKQEDGSYEKTFIGLKAWRDDADRMPDLRDGDVVLATGVIAMNEFTGRDGATRGGLELTIGRLDVCSVSATSFVPFTGDTPFTPAASPVPVSAAGFEEEFGDQGELPF